MVFFWIRLKITAVLAYWITAALIPVTVVALGLLFSEPGNLSIQIGIYGADFFAEQRLQAYGGTDWTVISYTDRETLRQDVANRRLELGYVFEAEEIILYTSPATMTERVTNLLVAAVHLETVAGEIGARVLSTVAMEANATNIQARVEGYLADGPLMERITVPYGEVDFDNAVPFRRLFHGLLALFAQLLAMLCAMSFTKQGERDITKRLRAIGRRKEFLYFLSGLLVVLVLCGAVMALTIAVGYVMFPGVWLAQDTPAALLYLLMLSFLAVLLARILPSGAFTGFLTLSFIFTALMGGVLFDLREVFEAVGFLRFLFPSYYYMVYLR